MASLFTRLSMVFALVLLVLGMATWFIARQSQYRYFEEYAQALNRPVAMYMATQVPLFQEGKVNHEAFSELRQRINMINPSLDIYLLDNNGSILAASGDTSTLVVDNVDIQPILRFIKGPPTQTIHGDNPAQSDEKRVFSAFSFGEMTYPGAGCDLCGYVYVILGGQKYTSVWQSISNSHSLRSTTVLLLSVLLLSLVFGLLLFHWLTKPLMAMTKSMTKWQLVAMGKPENKFEAVQSSGLFSKLKKNELVELEETCELMANRLYRQYQVLQHTDNTRRNFLTNVSHDLRTPLTSLSGAIETLVEKRNLLTTQQQDRLLLVAQRQSKRLSILVGQVFDLARLDTGDIRMNMEPVALLELVSDATQDLEPFAAAKGIKLEVKRPATVDSIMVLADIAWLHRVLDNLIVNAIKHSASGSFVIIEMIIQPKKAIWLSIRDSGVGFDRTLSGVPLRTLVDSRRTGRAISTNRYESDSGTGLGLGIVVKVLRLHKTQARVWSQPKNGCCIRFPLELIA